MNDVSTAYVCVLPFYRRLIKFSWFHFEFVMVDINIKEPNALQIIADNTYLPLSIVEYCGNMVNGAAL